MLKTLQAHHYRGGYFHSSRDQHCGKENFYYDVTRTQKDHDLPRQFQENLNIGKISTCERNGIRRAKLEEGQRSARRSRSEGNERRIIKTLGKIEKRSSSSHGFWSSHETHVKTMDEGDVICRLRTFNNWAKSYLMIKSLPRKDSRSTIGLDLGCSKGTDLKKWHHCHIDQLYLVEKDPSAMKECQQRFTGLQSSWQNFYNATFIQKDFTTEYICIPKKVDIVSCQMALHQAFESQKKAERMAKNVANFLKSGGTFVASITCSSKILECLKSSPTGTKFGNPIYEVKTTKPLPRKLPDFGVKFEFMLGHNKFQEYLVQIPVLEKVMAKFGLVLIERKTFLDMYFEARRNAEQIRCMHKMGVIRWGHERKDNHKVYLTMSEFERQAASLYEALTFKKIA